VECDKENENEKRIIQVSLVTIQKSDEKSYLE
jgi:hypothetical protein